jgi:DNA transposition AAA+ family ATPase
VAFLETKAYRRFAEFCDACRQHRYIGLCHGVPGVGKTLSAWQYTQWHLIQPYFPERFYDEYRLSFLDRVIAQTIARNQVPLPPESHLCRSILYTPSIANTPKRVEQEIRALRLALSSLVDLVQSGPSPELLEEFAPRRALPDPTDLIIVDEADRLKTAPLEQIRDIYDHRNVGVVLIGMPGLEKRLSRYPQLYSRVGFVHEFRPLNAEESRLFLARQWHAWGLTLQPDNATEADAITAIIRITNGNFRLRHRLLAQIARIVDIHALRMVSKEVVEVARQQLVIGSS